MLIKVSSQNSVTIMWALVPKECLEQYTLWMKNLITENEHKLLCRVFIYCSFNIQNSNFAKWMNCQQNNKIRVYAFELSRLQCKIKFLYMKNGKWFIFFLNLLLNMPADVFGLYNFHQRWVLRSGYSDWQLSPIEQLLVAWDLDQ